MADQELSRVPDTICDLDAIILELRPFQRSLRVKATHLDKEEESTETKTRVTLELSYDPRLSPGGIQSSLVITDKDNTFERVIGVKCVPPGLTLR